jgi:hypothetical protein
MNLDSPFCSTLKITIFLKCRPYYLFHSSPSTFPFFMLQTEPEPLFVNVYEAQESVPRNWFRQAGWNRFLGSLKGLQQRDLIHPKLLRVWVWLKVIVHSPAVKIKMYFLFFTMEAYTPRNVERSKYILFSVVFTPSPPSQHDSVWVLSNVSTLKGSRQSRGVRNVSNCPNLAQTASIEVRFSLNFAVVFYFIYFRFRPSKQSE